jgi:protein-S-isoprenylcysteine O-methyltransferase Ste14
VAVKPAPSPRRLRTAAGNRLDAGGGLDETAEQLAALLGAESDLLSLSHELKTPLTALRGSALTALDEFESPTGRSPSIARHLLLGRIGPAVLFGIFGWLNLRQLAATAGALDPDPSISAVLAGPVSLGLYCVFVAIPVLIYIGRPMPAERDGRLAVRMLALAGTTMLLIFGAVFGGGPVLLRVPGWAHETGTALLIAAECLAIWSLASLRTDFSIVPEARRLTETGPYRLVRHPLYLAEIAAAFGLLLQRDLTTWSVPVLASFVAVQYGRSVAEERLLRNALPSYDGYAERTPDRLLPLVAQFRRRKTTAHPTRERVPRRTASRFRSG